MVRMDVPPEGVGAAGHGYLPAPQNRYARRTVDGERLIAVFSDLVEPIGRTLPASSEVVLHDLSLLPNSIVAVYGNVTDRRVGDPATDLLLERAVAGFDEHYLGYETRLPDGRRMRSSTMIIRDVAGNPVAALCINTDLSTWISVSRIAAMMIGGDADAAETPSRADVLTLRTALADDSPVAVGGDGVVAGPSGLDAAERRAEPAETFVHHVDELAALLINQAIKSTGVPVELMKKEHKLAVVRELKAKGMFLLREAVEMVSESLEVSRFTIYNYLNEITDEPPKEAPATAAATRKARRGTGTHA